MKTPDTKAAMRIARMTTEEQQSLEAFEKSVLATVGNHTEWVTEKPTVKSMAEAIRNTEFGKVKGTPGEDGRYVIISYQPKLAAETTTMPHLRTPPLRNNAQLPGGAHYKRLIQAVVQSRSPADSDECGQFIDPGDVFVVGDSGKHGNFAALMSPFVSDDGTYLAKVSKTLYVHYNEEDTSALHCVWH
jgi:hypothetical protein